MFRDELFDDHGHNKSPEKVGHNELLELSETIKDIKDAVW